MNKKQFRELFLKLTEYTVPFEYEETLEPLLPRGYKRDSVGNFYYEIGNSETLFTTHLDTYSLKREKVNHVFDKDDEYIIGTDEKTILGGDNKLGCSILIGMIQNRIPGTYFFFIGEEPILSGGLYGSSKALSASPDYFKKFKRAIAFDRKEYGGIVVRQMARMCCSSEFADAIKDEFSRLGSIKSVQQFGYYTDTATFMDVIPECTNISVGGFYEHYVTECVDLNYTYQVYQAALKTNWENLPVSRQLENRFIYKKNVVKDMNNFLINKNIESIKNMCKLLGLKITRDAHDGDFRYLTLSKWVDNYDLDIFLKNEKVYNKDRKEIDFKKEILKDFADDILDELKYYKETLAEAIKFKDKDLRKKTSQSINDILTMFNYKNLDDMIKKLS